MSGGLSFSLRDSSQTELSSRLRLQVFRYGDDKTMKFLWYFRPVFSLSGHFHWNDCFVYVVKWRFDCFQVWDEGTSTIFFTIPQAPGTDDNLFSVTKSWCFGVEVKNIWVECFLLNLIYKMTLTYILWDFSLLLNGKPLTKESLNPEVMR